MQKSRAAIHKKHLASVCAAHRYPVTLTSLYPFFGPNFERAKVNNIPIFRELSVYTNGHGVIIIGIIGSRFATLLHHSLVQLCCKFKACGL